MTASEIQTAVNKAVDAPYTHFEAIDPETGTRLPYLNSLVVFEDGARYQTHADQRDMRRGGIAVATDPQDDPLGWSRACAWAYLTRTEQITIGWAEFDRTAAWVVPLEEDDSGADPTGTATAG